jgi:hypothetical protein
VFPPNLDWQPGASANVAQFAYDGTGSRLYVIFTSGNGGYYADVPPAVARAFADSPSRGRFVWYYLRNGGRDDRYAWVRL